MENIVLLGATGSIGTSVLDVIRSYSGNFRLIGVSGYKNFEKLEEILREFKPEYACLMEENNDFIKKFPEIEFSTGENGLKELTELNETDTVIIAVSGIAGLFPTLSAIKAKKRVLSANKESIVAAGEIIGRFLKENNQIIVPLDSEHNAIFNIFQRLQKKFIKSITLTASGGPFLNKEITESITIKDVLDHPTWEMGNYITVNCATMINKGFEVIEAHYLFNMDYDSIRVMIHPQSLVHGAVETADGSFFMAASPSDMRYPIALAMFYPEIPAQKFPPLDLKGKKLEFFEPDHQKFPLLKLAYESGKEGGLMPAVLNAANEAVVNSFLQGAIPFYSIPAIIQKSVDSFIKKSAGLTLSIEEIMEADRFTRQKTVQIISNR